MIKAWSITRWLFAALLALSAMQLPAYATGTQFGFYSDEQKDGFHFLLQIQGRDDDGFIQVQWTGQPKDAPLRNSYYVEMNRAQKRLYVRPRKRDGQPWFELDVVGDRGTLLFEGRRLYGKADWEIL
ncbi:hypothetical protein D3C81_681560 [compost metagenome]